MCSSLDEKLSLTFHSLVARTPRRGSTHDEWFAIETDHHSEGNWPGRLTRLCKVDKIQKIELASNFEDVATKFVELAGLPA